VEVKPDWEVGDWGWKLLGEKLFDRLFEVDRRPLRAGRLGVTGIESPCKS